MDIVITLSDIWLVTTIVMDNKITLLVKVPVIVILREVIIIFLGFMLGIGMLLETIITFLVFIQDYAIQ